MGVGYITDDWDVYDGAHVEHNCTDFNKAQYSYNPAVLIQGMAFMWNFVSLPSAPNFCAFCVFLLGGRSFYSFARLSCHARAFVFCVLS